MKEDGAVYTSATKLATRWRRGRERDSVEDGPTSPFGARLKQFSKIYIVLNEGEGASGLIQSSVLPHHAG